MTSKTLITGGTGTLGRHLVPRLRAAGHDIRVLSRHGGAGADGVETVRGDLATGEGIDAAVSDAGVIVHLAGSNKGDDDKARQLVRAAGRAGTRHLVYISVVGADRLPMSGRLDRAMFGYFGAKLAAEHAIAESGIPWTTLRSTQFHDLLLMAVAQMARLPVVPVPAGFRFQPIDASEVADRLAELALGPPAGRVADIGGPEVLAMSELVRGYLRATGRTRPVVEVPVPGRAARAFRDGANLAPDRAVGRVTLDEFLSDHVVATRAREATAT